MIVKSEYKRVLVADDDSVMRLLMRQSLEQDGYIVEDVTDGQAALDMFADNAPDFVLLDVEMPVMNGFEALQAIRAMPEGENVPVIMVTGYDDYESVSRAYLYGATDFITKPINWQLFNYHLKCILNRYTQSSRNSAGVEKVAATQKIASFAQNSWTMESEILEMNKLNRIRAINRDSMGDIVPKILHMYCNDSASIVSSLTNAVSSADSAMTRSLAHSLKASSGNVGAIRLASICKQLENCARTGSMSEAGAIMSIIEQEYEKACSAMQIYIGGASIQ
ncbi:MAG: response regulator [Nitrospira sp.]|nr:response regulator [bacterium]MBL7049120.1 response regulator [Nitrospira sp.]